MYEPTDDEKNALRHAIKIGEDAVFEVAARMVQRHINDAEAMYKPRDVV